MSSKYNSLWRTMISLMSTVLIVLIVQVALAVIVGSPMSCLAQKPSGAESNATRSYAIIDRTGKIRVRLPYTFVKPFSEGLAVFVGRNNLYGYVDKTGREVIAAQFVSAEDFSEGLASVTVSHNGTNACGYIDKSGKMVIAPRFLSGEPFHNNVAAVVIKELPELIDRSGNILKSRGTAGGAGEINSPFSQAPILFKDNLLVVKNKQYSVLKLAAGYVPQSEFVAGLCRVKYGKDGEYVGFIDQSGSLHAHGKFFDAADFSENLCAVALTGVRWGYMNKAGSMMIPAQFESASNFSEGLAAVRSGMRSWFIDTKGNVAITPGYYLPSSFSEGLAQVSKYDLFGYIDRRGQLVIPYQYLASTPFKDGLALVALPAPPAGALPVKVSGAHQ